MGASADQLSCRNRGSHVPRLEGSSLREELGLGPVDRPAIAVGNLHSVKGHAHLLEALGLLHPRIPEPHVAIAVRGALKGALGARADELGLSERFHLLGYRKDVATANGAVPLNAAFHRNNIDGLVAGQFT